ncbi:ATP-dependent RNA helicase DbpA [Marinomonas agarivorans]|nr:ATP-dependent RNA helicase DbpA [Marinomonas agarivorans]
MTHFSHQLDIQLPAKLTHLLSDLGFETFTPVQAATLPAILAKQDVLAQAQTGSGKTLAFAIGMLLKINPRYFGVQALVICPTRELADQVSKETRKVARFLQNIKVLSLCGGMPFGPQISSLEHGAHIVVGTPGRLLEHVRKGTLQLNNLQTLVLDEADRMLDMGFIDSIRTLVKETPNNRQTLLFSATYPDSIQSISQELQNTPANILIETTETTRPDIQQYFVKTSKEEKLDSLLKTLQHIAPRQAVVFCNTKAECQTVADFLDQHKVSAKALHGDLEQKMRDLVLVQFSNASCRLLIATDVAARGIDVKDVDAVINFDTTRDIDVHTHRIGRTGRAGSKGIAVNLVTEKDNYKVQEIEKRFAITADYLQLNTQLDLDFRLLPTMATIGFDAGRKDKLRPGDIVGALTAGIGLQKEEIGKIHVFDRKAYVAINNQQARSILQKLQQNKIKGRAIKVRIVR